MLSYQHGYHAGNHADVLKHLVLCRVLEHLNQKPRGWTYLDTHAGAGAYDLSGEKATKTGDAATGFLKLRAAENPPAAVAAWLVRSGTNEAVYPGSPMLAGDFARDVDRLVFCERHPAEFRALESLCLRYGKRVRCIQGDGLAAIKYTLPPPTRRGAILIDPAYERPEEWSAVVDSLAAGMRRFATGTFMIWFPRLRDRDNTPFERRLRAGIEQAWLQADLDIGGDRNLRGSSLFIVNPPWTLAGELKDALPWLVERLGEDEGAGWSLRQG